MKKLVSCTIVAAFFIFANSAQAQGSGSSKDGVKGRNNLAITRTVSGVIRSINGNRVSIRANNRKAVTVIVGKNTRGGRSCLVAGRRAVVTYLPANRQATVIRCR